MSNRPDYTPRPTNDTAQEQNNADLRNIILAIYRELDRLKQDITNLQAGD